MLFYTGISGGVASCQQPKKTFLYPKRTHFYIIPSPAFGVVLEYDRASEEDADAYQCWVHLKYLKIWLVQTFNNHYLHFLQVRRV